MQAGLTALLILLFPYLAQRYLTRLPLIGALGAVAWCYGIGILVANLPGVKIPDEPGKTLAYLCLLLGLPLLLFTTDLQSWLKQAPRTLLSFGTAVVSGVVAAITFAHVFAERLSEPAITAAMLTGVYTGGTPNMNAIGLMLHAPSELFALLNASDIFWGGLLFLFLITLAPWLYGIWLPAHRTNDKQAHCPEHLLHSSLSPRDTGLALLLSLATAGLAIALIYLLFGRLDKPAWLFLLLTVFSLAASLLPKVRQLQGSYAAGEYAILAFCVAIGLQADLSQLQAKGSAVFQFTGLVMWTTVVLHFLLAKALRTDRDTTLITLTAALYGPAFIPQVAAALDNRQIVLSGILSGLAGYALGNFVGLLVWQILH